MNNVIAVRCVARPRSNMVDILVNGRRADAAAAGGDLVRRYRGIVRDLRTANPEADFVLPIDPAAIIRDASALLS